MFFTRTPWKGPPPLDSLLFLIPDRWHGLREDHLLPAPKRAPHCGRESSRRPRRNGLRLRQAATRSAHARFRRVSVERSTAFRPEGVEHGGTLFFWGGGRSGKDKQGPEYRVVFYNC